MVNNLKPPGYIVVEGPIGVGKTSLVQRLAASFACESLLEMPETNPFLKKFYQDPQSAALSVQLHFLLQRAKQLDSIKQRDLFQGALVADFMFEKDRLFAKLNLDQDELQLYDRIYGYLAMEMPEPDLIVFLTAPIEVLMQRIDKRGRAAEKTMNAEYLQRLSNCYTNFFYHYNQVPMLIVNTGDINPIDNEDDYSMLLERICATEYGKHFFNPISLDLQ